MRREEKFMCDDRKWYVRQIRGFSWHVSQSIIQLSYSLFLTHTRAYNKIRGNKIEERRDHSKVVRRKILLLNHKHDKSVVLRWRNFWSKNNMCGRACNLWQMVKKKRKSLNLEKGYENFVILKKSLKFNKIPKYYFKSLVTTPRIPLQSSTPSHTQPSGHLY